jgi:hypothetical protein
MSRKRTRWARRGARLASVTAAVLAGGFIFSGAPAWAVGGTRPVIEPEPPTNISEQGGTLNVQINPEGSETGYEIRMECEAPSMSELTGCDPELFPGERLRAGQLVASFTDQTVSVTLTGLQPGYVYMYVIFATNAGGATERGANILQTYPPGAYPEGSPGKQYEPGPPSQASLEFAQQEADRLTAKAEAERQQQAREHEEQKARETAAVYAAEVAALKRREEEAAAAKTGVMSCRSASCRP